MEGVASHVASRVGILLNGQIWSVRMRRVEAFPSEVGEIQEWLFQHPQVEEDSCMIGYFYRCLEEESEFYYIYESDGWKCGGVTWDTPLRGRLVPLEEARRLMEQWTEDLKCHINTSSQ